MSWCEYYFIVPAFYFLKEWSDFLFIIPVKKILTFILCSYGLIETLELREIYRKKRKEIAVIARVLVLKCYYAISSDLHFIIPVWRLVIYFANLHTGITSILAQHLLTLILCDNAVLRWIVCVYNYYIWRAHGNFCNI